MPDRIVVVGAGQASAQAVDTLRRNGHAGSLAVIGNEPYAPYQRPPLSKKYLAGSLERERLAIRQDAFYTARHVNVLAGRQAVELDRARKRVHLEDGTALQYDSLLLATGSTPRCLSVRGVELAGVHYLRTIADADRIRAEVSAAKRIVIVGGGYIGLEVAATLRKSGTAVIVLEVADRVMNRVVSEPVSRFYEAEHREHGVEILLNTRLKSLAASPIGSGSRAHVGAVRCADGSELPADLVIIGIGVVPNVDVARAAGLECDDGIVVDEYCRTSDPAIYAAGDCTRHPNKHFGARVRLESVDNACEQGNVAALNMLGQSAVHDKVPWFWSDQYDLKLVIVGLSRGFDDVVLRGDPSERSFSVCYLKAGALIAIETINHSKDQGAARRMVAACARPDRVKLADPSVPLMECV